MFNYLNEYIAFSTKINDYISTIMRENKISCEEYRYTHVWEVVKSQGVAIRGFDFEGIASKRISGMLFQDSLETTIVFNQQLNNQNKKFVISHEIVHYLFHKTDENVVFVDSHKDIQSSSHKELREFQANIGASAILIPDRVLVHFLKKGWGLAQLSDHFEISENHLSGRLIQMMQANLGLCLKVAKNHVDCIRYQSDKKGSRNAFLIAVELEYRQKEHEWLRTF